MWEADLREENYKPPFKGGERKKGQWHCKRERKKEMHERSLSLQALL